MPVCDAKRPYEVKIDKKRKLMSPPKHLGLASHRFESEMQTPFEDRRIKDYLERPPAGFKYARNQQPLAKFKVAYVLGQSDIYV